MERVLDFWFHELQPADWWRKNPDLDNRIRQRFASLHAQVAAGEMAAWRAQPRGALAEVIVLDQFSRNMFRDTEQAFAFDGQAQCLAQVAVARGFDEQLAVAERSFLYMPFMHSESAKVHEQAVQLFASLANPQNLQFELQHKAIIDRFGRYPHRNRVLGRQSTEAERLFLTEPGSSF